jgi:predicted Rossmann fold nucleotide-binding protein DprA/Smf involved in DNA uptake
MVCKKSELVSAINSFAAARATGDHNLIAMSAQLVQTAVDSLEFAPETEEEAEEAAE